MTKRLRIVLLVAVLLLLGLIALAVRPMVVEKQVKRNIGAATRVLIQLADPTQMPQPLRDWRITDKAAVSYLASLLLEGTRRSNPYSDKCFEGFEELHGRRIWPTVSFDYGYPRWQHEVIYLPLGGCQVWPARLPWGWGGSGTAFASEVNRLTRTDPPGTVGDISGLRRRGWDLMPTIEYCFDAWLPPAGIDPSRYHPGYVEGDFNGDGKKDWAVQVRSRDGKTVRFLIVHGPPERAKSFEIYRRDYRDGLQGGYDGYTFYLWPRQPGLVTYWTGSGPTGRLDLKHDGVEVIFAGKASSLYYWTGSGYASTTTSD